jgi:hypothetical protein
VQCAPVVVHVTDRVYVAKLWSSRDGGNKVPHRCGNLHARLMFVCDIDQTAPAGFSPPNHPTRSLARYVLAAAPRLRLHAKPRSKRCPCKERKRSTVCRDRHVPPLVNYCASTGSPPVVKMVSQYGQHRGRVVMPHSASSFPHTRKTDMPRGRGSRILNGVHQTKPDDS